MRERLFTLSGTISWRMHRESNPNVRLGTWRSSWYTKDPPTPYKAGEGQLNQIYRIQEKTLDVVVLGPRPPLDVDGLRLVPIANIVYLPE